MMARTHIGRSVMSMFATGLLAGCATNPPPLPAGNPADPQLRASSKVPRNLLQPDETTLAIEKALKATQAQAASAETMSPEMPSMKHGKKEEDHEKH